MARKTEDRVNSITRIYPDFRLMDSKQMRPIVEEALRKAVEEKRKSGVNVAYLLKVAYENKLYAGQGFEGSDSAQLIEWAMRKFALEASTIKKYLQVGKRFLEVRDYLDENGNVIDSFVGSPFDTPERHFSIAQLQELVNIDNDDVIAVLVDRELVRPCDTSREIRAVKGVVKALPQGWHTAENPGALFKAKALELRDSAQQGAQPTQDSTQPTQNSAQPTQDSAQQGAQPTQDSAQTTQDSAQTTQDSAQQGAQPTTPENSITAYLDNMCDTFGTAETLEIVSAWMARKQ